MFGKGDLKRGEMHHWLWRWTPLRVYEYA